MSHLEFPVYVPFEDEHLVGVLCAPEGGLQDLGVLLLTGGNYTRTHRNRMWVRAARELASAGIPSLRFDYAGVGDSTGRVVLSMDEPPWREASAMADFLERSTGVGKITLAATCFGGRVAAAVAAARDDVVGVTALPVPVLLPDRSPAKAPLRRRIRQRLKASELGSKVLRHPRIRRARSTVAAHRGRTRPVVNAGLRKDIAGAVEKGVEVRFVFGERSKELPDLRSMVEQLRQRLGPREMSRISIDVIEGTDIHRFQTSADQRIVIDSAVAAGLRALGREPSEAGR